jgi:hypothetical protein
MDEDASEQMVKSLMFVPADALEKCRSPRALKVLLDGLADHYYPKVCHYILIGAIGKLTRSDGAMDEQAHHVFGHPTVLDAFVAWLTAPRTRAEMNVFLLALECSCNVPNLEAFNQQLHVLGRQQCPPARAQTPAIDSLVGTLSFQLTPILSVMQPGRFKFYKVCCAHI